MGIFMLPYLAPVQRDQRGVYIHLFDHLLDDLTALSHARDQIIGRLDDCDDPCAVFVLHASALVQQEA
jgi:hypothetical protein